MRACAGKSAEFLDAVRNDRRVVLDADRHVLGEYTRNARSTGEPGPGDAFLKWVLTNQTNPTRCLIVVLTPDSGRGFEEFPVDAELTDFDQDDRVFVSLALTVPAELFVAVDTDFWEFQRPLRDSGLSLTLLCPELLEALARRKGIGPR
jgi:hypothetical protein